MLHFHVVYNDVPPGRSYRAPASTELSFLHVLSECVPWARSSRAPASPAELFIHHVPSARSYRAPASPELSLLHLLFVVRRPVCISKLYFFHHVLQFILSRVLLLQLTATFTSKCTSWRSETSAPRPKDGVQVSYCLSLVDVWVVIGCCRSIRLDCQ